MRGPSPTKPRSRPFLHPLVLVGQSAIDYLVQSTLQINMMDDRYQLNGFSDPPILRLTKTSPPGRKRRRMKRGRIRIKKGKWVCQRSSLRLFLRVVEGRLVSGVAGLELDFSA